VFRSATTDRRRGLTLLEIIVATAVMAVLMTVLGNILVCSTRSVDALVVDSVSDQEIKKGLSRLINELETSASTVVAIDSSNASFDQVTFQTPGTYNGAISWGATDASAAWHSLWTVRYKVSGGLLVRRVINSTGNQVGSDELLVRKVDDLSGGVKGFGVARIGQLVNITIRVRKTFQDGKDYVRQYDSSVLLKNG
jgi:prepilin-type N-terminal cleavage/methylation domain-containing protein